jgi:flagellar hook protein FlgE
VTIDTDGSMKIYGDAGEDYALSNIAIRETGNDPFNTVMTFNEIQKAKDVTHSTSITVYDAVGESHILTMEFKKTSIRNQWEWEVTMGGNEIISSGNTGTVTFNTDGSLNSFIYDNGVSALEFEPGTGADTMKIQFEMGEPGSFGGVTQFSSLSTTVANAQDGYANGDLVNINIDKTGKITGVFSNGINQTMAQIVMAKFNNPNGLYREGNNMFTASANSGLPIYVTAGENIQSEIIPGSLEMSNVDLAREFTDMILAQRGYQANARVITTSDDLLNELVNIKR